MSTCKNCDTEINNNYCPNCGRAVKLHRIDAHYIQHEIEHVVHFEKGILFTVRELLLRPGKNIKAFISEDRNRLVKPIIFIIISSLIYSLVNHFFHLEDGYVKVQEDKRTSISIIFDWLRSHYGYANILMGVFITLWLKLFFKKHQYNFFELLILLCFVMGMGMLLLALFAILEGLTKIHLMQIASMIIMAYFTWAIGQFFDKKKVGSYLKAFAAYLLGMITFTGSGILIGFLFDLIFKPSFA